MYSESSQLANIIINIISQLLFHYVALAYNTYHSLQNSTYVEYIFIISSGLVANGANINGQDEDGLTPLQKVLQYFVNTLTNT